jgi:cell division protein ZipA
MSWAGAALGKLTAGMAASKARADEQKVADQRAADQKAADQQAERRARQQQASDDSDDGDYADPLADYTVDHSRDDEPARAHHDEYQDEFQAPSDTRDQTGFREDDDEGFHEEFHEEFQQDTRSRADRANVAYTDDHDDVYAHAEAGQYNQPFDAPLTEQEKKIAKYGESPYAGHRFGVDSVPADPVLTAAPVTSSPYSDSRPSAESPTQPVAARPAASTRAPTTASARSLRENQLSLDMPQEEDDRDPGYSQVLVINVMARPKTVIQGDELLPLLLGAGLRFGEMSIFHRHADRKGGPVLFSVANALNPGTFDLNRISDFSTQGVCFFMTLPNVANNMLAFEQMLATAKHVQSALDAELKDDNRSVMTAQTVEHYRQRIRDFDLQQLKNSKNPRQK